MANPEHVERIKRSVSEWNAWRDESRPRNAEKHRRPDLSGADLQIADLRHADLSFANLNGANLRGAHLIAAVLLSADLRRTNLSGALLTLTNLFGADLNGANLTDADLTGANLSGAWLIDADFNRASLKSTVFANSDLRPVRNLDRVAHRGPSLVDHTAIEASRGRIPPEFLRSCGLQPWEVAVAELYGPDLTPFEVSDLTMKVFDLRTTGPMFLGGVFISYSRDNSPLVDKLETRLNENGCVVWRDIHDLVAGPIVHQITEAIRLQDSVVVILSKESIASDWVADEVEKTRAREKKEKRDFLCPIALDDSWKALDHPLWTHLKREKNIVDFRGWNDDAKFDEAFGKLVRGLKLYYPPGERPAAPR